MMPGLKIAWEVQQDLLPGESVDNSDALGSFLRPLQIWKEVGGTYVYSGHNPELVDFDQRIIGKGMTWRGELKRKWPESWLPEGTFRGLLISGNLFPMMYIGPLEVEEEHHTASLWEVTPERGDHRVAITYAEITPESAEHGDFDDTGWVNEEGEDVNGDEDMTAVDRTVQFLQHEGVQEASTWPNWQPGVWYSRMTEADIQTGVMTEYSYHLKGFTPEEEELVYNNLMPQHLQNRRTSLKFTWEERQGFKAGDPVKVVVPERRLRRMLVQWNLPAEDYDRAIHIMLVTPAMVSAIELGDDDRPEYYVTWPDLDEIDVEQGGTYTDLSGQGFWLKLEELSEP
jgi:hypothetical protein